MRAVGIVSRLGVEPGLYTREGAAVPQAMEVWNTHLAAVRPTPDFPRFAKELAALYLLGPFGYELWKLWEKSRNPPALARVAEAQLPKSGESSARLPHRVVLIPASALHRNFADFDAPIFHGLFAKEDVLQSLMEAEGGHSELLIVDHATANATYRHAGGAQLGLGLHLPHPKDPAVLIPVSNYSDFLKREAQTEWLQVFEALGAAKVVIADATNVSANAKGSGANPAGSVSVEMRAAYGNSNVEESTYAPGTFDPGRARRGRRWLGDYPEILAIVEGRESGRQLSWRKTVKVNCSFGASVKFLSVATATKGGASLGVEYERTYDFFVEFHGQPTAR